MTSSAKTIEGAVQAKIVPFSSVVGQSIMLTDETGAVVAQLSILIPSPSYSYRETAEEVASIIETAVNQPPSQQLKKLRARLGQLMVEDAKRMAALENCKANLADATSNPPLSDLSSLRKGAEDRIRELENVLRKAKAFHDRDSGLNGFTADYECLRWEINDLLGIGPNGK